MEINKQAASRVDRTIVEKMRKVQFVLIIIFCLSICVNGIKKGRFQPYSVLKPSEEIVMNVKLRKKFPEHRPMLREFF